MINVQSHNVMFIAYFQHTNTSAIAIATKLAAMSPRCYSLAEKTMDMYEGGELEKKKKKESTIITIHGSYFNFLYNVDPLKNEDEMCHVLQDLVQNKRKSGRKTVEGNKSTPKVR